MKKPNRDKAKFDLSLFLVVEAVLFVSIQLAQSKLPQKHFKKIMFLAIFINTVHGLYIFFRYTKRKFDEWNNMLVLGLTANLLADVFLTLIAGPAMQIPGYAAFCVVESIYAIYLRPSKCNIIIRILLLLFLWLFAWSISLLTIANAIGLLNISLLIVNTLSAWRLHRDVNCTASFAFAVGISFFLVGDICVAIELFLVPGTILFALVAHLIWVFYLPAQVAIVISYWLYVHYEIAGV